jgi:tol-pal system protein YbgF
MHRNTHRWGPRGLGAVLCVAGFAAFATGCATTAEYRRLERQVRELRATGAGSNSAAVETADLGIRLDELDARLNEIQGYLEQIDHRSERALEEATAARSDAAEARGDADTARRDAGEAMRLAGEAREAMTQAASTAAAANLSVAVTPTPDVSPDPALSIPGAPAPDPAPAPSAEPGAAGGTGVIEAYRAAYAAWRNDDTQACIDQFRQFLQTKASSPFADDASFWMADCYFKQGDYKTAILRFDDVVSRYPTGNKAADALYRQGEALLRLGPGYTKAAGKAFERVLREYPESDRAIEARRQLEILGTG